MDVLRGLYSKDNQKFYEENNLANRRIKENFSNNLKLYFEIFRIGSASFKINCSWGFFSSYNIFSYKLLQIFRGYFERQS